ncbi:MAG TPA: MFS transporter [Cyclobacteriaceae bacterium]|nr:MFS transporter [Cyclobacteriaceae bacterium]
MGRIITKTVWVLSLVSLFTDMASEMLYPIMPLFLRDIGFSIMLIGVLEGVAEATAGLSKGYFGQLSDVLGRRLPFVRWGYALSALSKPLMALSTHVWWIFTVRTADRLGKGLRTAARDALLSAEATPETKARVFGLHRAMDTTGAFIGPALALLFLFLYPGQYKWLFMIALFPGLAAIALTLLLKDTSQPTRSKPVSLTGFVTWWKTAPASYRKVTVGLLAFALINSSDVFLLLRARDCGIGDTTIIGLYIGYNLIYAALAFPVGIQADRWGTRRTLVIGLVLFAIVYAGFGWANDILWLGILLAVYGLHAACTESIAKAWITNLVQKDQTATAIGTYTAFQSVATLFASTAAGIIWYAGGATMLFATTGMIALVLAVYFSQLKIVRQ